MENSPVFPRVRIIIIYNRSCLAEIFLHVRTFKQVSQETGVVGHRDSPEGRRLERKQMKRIGATGRGVILDAKGTTVGQDWAPKSSTASGPVCPTAQWQGRASCALIVYRTL